MKVILLKDVPTLGRTGEVREVKDGYARNYLLPRGLAAPATDSNVRHLQHTRKAAEHREARLEHEAGTRRSSLEALVVEVRAKTGEEGRLFGSVTAQDIAEAITRQGIEISKKQVELSEPIKAAGFYKVPVRLAHGHTAMVEVNVVGTS
jgi:large subunit ribosomal protein L9